MIALVIDTNILIAALLRAGGSARRVLRCCLTRGYQPLIGAALFAEYEELLSRKEVWKRSALTASEREDVFNGFLTVCRWVEVFFAWRPNLPDEADNHLVELAVAGNAAAIITRNTRDLARGELRFPQLKILTPGACLEIYPCPH